MLSLSILVISNFSVTNWEYSHLNCEIYLARISTIYVLCFIFNQHVSRITNVNNQRKELEPLPGLNMGMHKEIDVN